MLAAVLKGAISSEPNTTVGPSAATNAAHQIVTETWTNNRPALSRADVARLAEVAGAQIGVSEEQKETIARALAELVKPAHGTPNRCDRTNWPLWANAQGLTDFIPEGEKRYWLHVARVET